MPSIPAIRCSSIHIRFITAYRRTQTERHRSCSRPHSMTRFWNGCTPSPTGTCFSLRAPRATKDDLAQLARLGEDIIRWQQSDEAIRGFKLNMLLYELLSLLYSRFVSGVRRPELVRSGRNITMQIIGYMTSHRKQHLEATDVAREFGYGREHFCRLFRKATGKTFKEFLTDLRLDDACRKLSGSSASIASIARECGFPIRARCRRLCNANTAYARRNIANDTKIETDIQ